MARLCLDWRKSFLICISWLLGGGFALALPANSNDCTGLLPDVIPEPRVRSLPMDPYSDCIRPTSSRSGILAFGLWSTYAFPLDRYWLYDGEDSQVGSFYESSNSGLYAPFDTFQLTKFRYLEGTRPPPNPTLVSGTDRGEPISSYELDPELRDSPDSIYLAGSDLVGGGIFGVYLRIRPGSGWQLESWRFDNLGTVLFGPVVIAAGSESPQSIRFSPGVDVNRNSLLLFQLDLSQPANAIWFDLAGEILATRDFQVGDLGSYRGRTPLTPLLDGSFVLRARGTGSLRIPAWDEAGDVGPAPQWIEDHPLADLYFIRGMRGYALAPGDFHSECESEISIFAPDGTFCGSFAPEPMTTCTAMVIGQDGTVFHPPDEEVPCSQPDWCGCTQHYWVGLLR
jgi:hypothetical protein